MPEPAIKVHVTNFMATPQASSKAEQLSIDLMRLLERHQQGDWGAIDSNTAFENELAWRSQRGVVHSVYLLPDGSAVVIDTRYNQAVTVACLPEEV